MADTQACTLYYDPRSICSSMVRYTLANAGPPAPGALPLSVDSHKIDLFQTEQLAEQYLCEVNPKGQVPVLSSPGYLDKPITDSLDITFWLCDRFPALRPQAHANDIDKLLREGHAINFFSLSMRNVPERATSMEQAVAQLVATPGISQRYREALKYKLKVVHEEKIDGIKAETVTSEIARTRTYLQGIEKLRNSSNGGDVSEGAWIFGTEEPTALDTFLVCLLARLVDVKLEEIVPKSLLDFVAKARNTERFKKVWQGL